MHYQWEKDFIRHTLHTNFSRPDDVHFYSLASHRYVILYYVAESIMCY